MARAGLASRREAEAWIAAGRVSVNGATITLARAQRRAERPHHRRRQAAAAARAHAAVPVSQAARAGDHQRPTPHGRPTIFGALPKDLPRLISVGRLDMNTEGLLLLTNDGGLARALELPATGWLRRYRVRAYGKVTQDRLDGLKNGIAVDGVHYGAIEADARPRAGLQRLAHLCDARGQEPRNPQRAARARASGEPADPACRTARSSSANCADGAVEEVKTRALREQIGARLAALAGADFSRTDRRAGGAQAASVSASASAAPRRAQGDSRAKGDAHRPATSASVQGRAVPTSGVTASIPTAAQAARREAIGAAGPRRDA